MSRLTGRTYRLPSEAEWEYACRAGTRTPFSFGEIISTDWANYDGNYIYGNGLKGESRKQTTPLGTFVPNAFGLQDMHGNVWEWCDDGWHDNYYENAPKDGSSWNDNHSRSKNRVVRGGSWDVTPEHCRSAYRYNNANRLATDGFRVVSSQDS